MVLVFGTTGYQRHRGNWMPWGVEVFLQTAEIRVTGPINIRSPYYRVAYVSMEQCMQHQFHSVF